MAPFNPFSIKNHLFFFSALSFLLCSFKGLYVYAALPYHKVEVNSLLPAKNCTASIKGSEFGAQKLKVTYKYGPCSPSGSGTGKKFQDSTQILTRDSHRVRSINHPTSHLYDTNESTENKQPVTTIGGSDYTVTIGFGTPKQDQTVMIDTGSDITWIKCKPCSDCDKTKRLFDPSKSTSYSNGSCKSTADPNLHYEDGSFSKISHYGCDTLRLEPSDVIQNFQFGCARKISSSDNFGNADGLLGLGQGKLSLVSQTASQFGKVFSYCLPHNGGSTGYLLFGQSAKSSSLSSSVKFTPLLQKKDSSYYFLQFNGITIGTKRLNITPATTTSMDTIIDSGTVITRLPQSTYEQLQSEFQQWMSKYPRASPPQNEKFLDTCYNLKGYNIVKYPKIAFHFGRGTDVNLDQSGILLAENEEIFCLAFAATEHAGDLNIIGNHQQKGLTVFYDIQNQRLGFGAHGCK